MNKFIILLGLLFSACDYVSSEKYEYTSTFHQNKCVKGASYILHESSRYKVGSKSNKKFNQVLNQLSDGKNVKFEPIASNGCEKIYKLQFNGEIMREKALTGYGNDEIHQVIQVYQFKFL
ncbi:MAG: hypothetical protein KC478_14710 [Bacteriovoracaceae bacterium]|nr:hypothetical protein [Bacteriovoracaceae bacterium]